MYKVFINNKALFLSSDPVFFQSFPQNERCKFEEIGSWEALLSSIENGETEQMLVFHDDIEEVFASMQLGVNYIEAAGGIVRNFEGNLLVIHRLGYWDLPKGKCEEGESIPETAVREVQEECGVTDLEITGEARLSYHCYQWKEKWCLKKTFWYPMKALKEDQLRPQTEEDIQLVKWMPLSDLDVFLANTYDSIAALLREENL